MKKIKGDLILTKDTSFDESIEVEGNIKGYYNLKVEGNIAAWDIDVWDIDAWNIAAWNIDAWNIVAGNIDARNINAGDIVAWDIVARNIVAVNIDARNIVAWDIVARNIDVWDIVFCETVKVKGKLKAKAVIRKKSQLEIKEFKSD